ncbi:sel1 repeat family protein [Enterovibrio calviensis]|uniref:sel1 repeat family protein n=1 Tax=Enterovibrio calviensis TaxID=91359 RepID=UPI0037364D65
MQLGLKASIVLSLLFLSGCVVDDATRANHQYEQGDIAEGKSVLTRLANDGYHDAKLHLARIYSNEMNTDAAAYWYQAASEAYPYAALEYARWQINITDAEQAAMLYDQFWHRQQTQGDAITLLVALYRKHYAVFDSTELVPLIEELIADNETPLAIQYSVAVSNVSPLYSQLLQYCDKNNVDDDTRLACTKLKLINAHALNDYEKMKAIRAELLTAYQSQDMSAETINEVASIAKNRRYGLPNIPLYISLAEITGTDDPDVWYDVAKRKIQAPNGEDNDLAKLLEQANQLTEEGHQYPHLILAESYSRGIAATQSFSKAIEHWLKASEIPKAQRLLGETYVSGAMGETHQQLGINWLLSAARNGDALAYLKLAEVFKEGNGIHPDASAAGVFASLHFELTQSSKSQKMLEELTPLLPLDISDRIEAEKLASYQNIYGVSKEVTP